MEALRDILIYFAGSVALAILCWQGHAWWLERQERKAREHMQERYWQEVTDEAVQYVEDLYSGKVDRP